jgi:two-component system, chemotaxis family, sensor histidine kinase and response regulator PixL
MSQDKEREIQLQFLEEAQEYLDTIESVLLGLAGSHIDGQQMDAVLRAAHSVKGGAGMMGYQTLSHLAHRLEDSFKVMKAQRNSLEVDSSLESLLLSAVDRLRQVLTLNRQGADVNPEWLESVGNPVFEQLHDRLGDPVADDAATMLGAEDGTNVAALLFETEVEGCLNRLEGVLADPQAPCLGEELEIMAQELGGLGEMLQLEAFTQLCESVIQHLAAAPQKVKEIASSALAAWKRSQALVLVGQVGSLPTQLEGLLASGEAVTQPVTRLTPIEAVEALDLDEVFAAEFDSSESFSFDAFDHATVVEPTLASLANSDVEQESPTDDVFDPRVVVPDLNTSVSKEVISRESTPLETVEEHDLGEVFAAEFDSSESFPLHSFDRDTSSTPTLPSVQGDDVFDPRVAASTNSAPLSRKVQTNLGEVPAADVRWREVKPDSAGATQPKESQENTVRIPVRQLDRLNDLFGELTIQRNGLGLHLGRLRNLIESLTRRVSTLEQSNLRLRTAYDTVATQAVREETGGWSASSRGSWGRREAGGSDRRGAGGEAHLRPELLSSTSPDPASPSTPSNPLLDSALSINSRFDALEMDRYSDIHLLSMEVMETIVQIQEVTSDIGLNLEDTDSTARELNQTAKQLQTNLTRLRMRPLSDLVGRFSRALRDLSLQYGKQVELKVYGKGTLIDRSILEALNDPLMHLVRNAFDHGIETPATRSSQGKPPQGTIEIKAAHRGNQTIITVSDDGNGINLNKIRARAEEMGLDAELLAAASEDELLSLIFEPGFSTADRVTDLSGRGVGMDVVRNNLKQIRGDIRVDTTPGQGTTFTLTVPFTLSVARVLLVESNGMLLAFPTDVIEEILLTDALEVLTTPGSEVLKWEGEMIPLTRLSEWLTFYCPRRIIGSEGVPSIDSSTVLMITQGEQLHGIQVDRCWGEREVAIRQVEGTLTMPPGFASCTILGDGKVVPLVDAASLLRWIASCDSETVTRSSAQGRGSVHHIPEWSAKTGEPQGLLTQLSAAYQDNPPAWSIPQSRKDTILVIDDSINVRRFLALALEKAGYLVEQAKDGQDAVEKLLGGLHVEAVICDIEMPRLDGYGFLARIKSDPAYERLPIAMLTSRSGEKHRQLAMTLGAAAYFSKPYNERELLRTLRQIITQSQERKPIPTGVR